MIHVVSVAIVRPENGGMVLLAQCGVDAGSYQGLWCTPGGKFEPLAGDFDHHSTANREAQEEVGVSFGALGPLVYEHDIASTRTGELTRVHCYRIDFRQAIGKPYPKDKTIGVGWFGEDDVLALCGDSKLTPADTANVRALLAAIRGCS